MNAAIARPVVDGHRQLHKNSCSTSLAEMMLKVGGKVPAGYYVLQALEEQQSTGLHHLKDKTIAGATFRTFPKNLTAVAIQARIKTELDAGRTVGLYLPKAGISHGWLVVELEPDALALLSKFSELGGNEGAITDELWFALADLEMLNNTDCIYYEE